MREKPPSWVPKDLPSAGPEPRTGPWSQTAVHPPACDAPGKGQTVGSAHKSQLGVQSQPKSPELRDNEETTTVISTGWKETASPPSTPSVAGLRRGPHPQPAGVRTTGNLTPPLATTLDPRNMPVLVWPHQTPVLGSTK